MAESIAMMKSSREKRKEDKLAQEEKELEELIKAHNEGLEQDENDDIVIEPEEVPDKKEEKEKSESKEPDKDPEPQDTEEKTWKKRYGDLRRHTDKKIKDLQDQIEEVKTQKTTSTDVEVPQSSKELSAWKDKNPDSYRIVENLANQIADEKIKDLQQKVDSLSEKTTENEKEKQLNMIKKAHPDFDDLQDDDEFHVWIDEQPKWIQDALYEEDDAKAAIRVIDMFKVDTKRVENPVKKEEKKAASEAAKSVSTKTKASVDAESQKGKIRESEVNEMSLEEYSKRSEEIDEAMRSGNFIYDLSGGAR